MRDWKIKYNYIETKKNGNRQDRGDEKAFQALRNKVTDDTENLYGQDKAGWKAADQQPDTD